MMEPSLEDVNCSTNADRGFIDRLDPCIIKDSHGRVVWDNDVYRFLSNESGTETANPKLWQQSQLTSKQGLFEVTTSIYQVRGLDLSNMTVIEGDEGVIVIDPLTSAECAEAALGLYRKNRGNRAVLGLIYTHCHADHFGAAAGVLSRSDSKIPILAPQGFLDHAISENIYAGNAMSRRATYMYGSELPKSAKGQISCGLGATVSTGTVTLLPPTIDIARTGHTEIIDGVQIV